MITLENLEYDEATKEATAMFGGFFEDDFKITLAYDYDEVKTEAEEDLGINESFEIENFTLWNVEVFDVDEKRINIPNYILIECKHDIEDYIIKKLTEI